MKRLILSTIFSMLLVPASHAAELFWDFERIGDGGIPSGWSRDETSFGAWRAFGGYLQTGLFDTDSRIQTPAFKYIAPATAAGGSSGGEFQMGTGASENTMIVSISDLYFNGTVRAPGAFDTLYIDLLHLHQEGLETNLLHVTNAIYSGPFSYEIAIPDFEPEGTYSVRFRAYDNDSPGDVYCSVSDVRITNATLVASGDYNDNGFVDAADYTIWRDTLGNIVNSGDGADGDFDGSIDQDDYLIWKSNFAHAAANSVLGHSSVPEPSASSSLVLIALLRFLSPGLRRAKQAGYSYVPGLHR